MGKTRIIAETGAGQHGVATATVCARFGLPCTVFMGAEDMRRQQPNVFRMRLLGADVRGVTAGRGTLKDAMNEALRDWVANVADTYYLIGTAAGPHPYPELVRDFQSVIGTEAREQIVAAEGRLPDLLVAAIGGGSNAIGLFHPFLDDADVRMIGVEAAGKGLNGVEHAASLAGGRPGVLHGNKTYLLQDEDGQITEGHSISAGLDYPGIGPEHSWLHEIGRIDYRSATDDEALDAFQFLCRTEGIIPALETRARASRRASGRDGDGPERHHRRQISAAAATRTSSPSPRRWEWSCDNPPQNGEGDRAQRDRGGAPPCTPPRGVAPAAPPPPPPSRRSPSLFRGGRT